jgi:ornithine cyclodeaminase
MRNGNGNGADRIVLMNSRQVKSVLKGRELDIVRLVRMAYETHANGDSSLPHSTFLRFAENERNRIIALPACLGQDFQVAGVKWIASFPGNQELNLDRASALVILNSTQTGRPQAILEGSVISAKRTAASAALAAQHLSQKEDTASVGIIGCGLINFETIRFLMAVYPDIKQFVCYDIDVERARQFTRKLHGSWPRVDAIVATDVQTVLRQCKLIAIATTALTPSIADLSECMPGSTILHTSLRDLTPEVILACDNIVDDVDHVCRAATSVHLAEQLSGNRDFIRCTLADITSGRSPARRDPNSIAVFSPFGLGVLDMALAQWVLQQGREQEEGTVIESFLPDSSWLEEE